MSSKKTVTVAATPSRCASIALGIVLAAAGAAAHGDWIVLTTGEAVETRGAWTLEGRKVVFTTTGGVLASVRASEVNLDSSRALTAKKQEEATRVSAPAPTPKRTPVLVLTDKDFEKAKPAADAGPPGGSAETGGASAAGAAGAEAGAATAEAGAKPGSAPAAQSAQPAIVPAADALETRVAHQMPGPPALRVTSWSARPTAEDQLSIFGAVLNVGSRVAAAINVKVTLFDSEGAQVGSTEAAVSSTALMPSVSADFEAKFDSSVNFAEVQFTVKTVEIELGKPPGGEGLDEPIEDVAPAAPAKGPATGKKGAVGDEPHATVKAAPAKPPSP